MPFKEVLINSHFQNKGTFFFFFFREVISKRKPFSGSSVHAGHLTQTVLREISPGLRRRSF